MEKLDMKDLVTALKKSRRTICIIGPFAEQYQVQYTEEEWNNLTHKSLVKHTEDFYRLFSRYFEVAEQNKNNPTYAYLKELKEMGLIHQFYIQHITSLYEDFEPVYLKGSGVLECKNCNATHTIEQAKALHYHCQKDHLIKPKAILRNGKYNLDILKRYDEDLFQADVVLLIGFDFNEEPLLDTIYSISNMKYRINKITKERFRTTTVAVEKVGEKAEAEALFNEYHFDFIVNEHPDTAMKRFNEIIKNTIHKQDV